MGRSISPAPGTLKRIDRGVITIPTLTQTGTYTLSPAVDTAKSTLRLLGSNGTSGGAPLGTSWPYVVLTNSTTITARRETGNADVLYVSWELEEVF